MKHIFLAFAVTIISSFALSMNATAQNDLGINEEDMPDLSRSIIINIPQASATEDTLKDVNERALKNFERSFPGAHKPSWYKTPGGYIVDFMDNAIQTKVAYDKKGRLNHIINYYGEEILPGDIRHIIKSVYYDYSILNIAEIHLNEYDAQPTYVVNIQDRNSLKILTIAEGEILSIKDYKRI